MVGGRTRNRRLDVMNLLTYPPLLFCFAFCFFFCLLLLPSSLSSYFLSSALLFPSLLLCVASLLFSSASLPLLLLFFEDFKTLPSSLPSFFLHVFFFSYESLLSLCLVTRRCLRQFRKRSDTSSSRTNTSSRVRTTQRTDSNTS